MVADIRAAAHAGTRDRSQNWAALNDLFRAGSPPAEAPNGRCAGSLVLLHVAPGLTQVVDAITAAWLPWKGKTFDPAAQTGDNIFTWDSLPLAHLFWPLYRGIVDDGPQTFRAFKFRTYFGPGLVDPDRQVFKIDYARAENPGLTIRRVLDEIVQLKDGVFLGKAHLHLWWGRWQTVAYFMLETG